MTALQSMKPPSPTEASPEIFSLKRKSEFSKHELWVGLVGFFLCHFVFRTFQGCYLYVQVTDLVLKQKNGDSVQRIHVDVQYAQTSIQAIDPRLKYCFENMGL